MQNHPASRTAEAVDSTLRSFPKVEVRRRNNTWSVKPRRKKALPTTISLRGRWMEIEQPLQAQRTALPMRQASSEREHAMLRKQNKFSGLLKVSVGGSGAPTVRADIPFARNAAVEFRLFEAMAEFLHQESALKPKSIEALDGVGILEEQFDLHAALDESGWDAREIEDGKYRIDLDTARQSRRVVVTTGPGGRTEFRVDLHSAPAPAGIQRTALCAYLLTSNAHTRLVRFGLDSPGKQEVTVTLSAIFPSAPNAFEVAKTMESLASAVTHCGNSIPFLFNDAVAEAYLTAQHLQLD